MSTFHQGSILQVAYLRTQTWQGSTKCYYRCNFRDFIKDSNLKAKDWRFKAKARTKDWRFKAKARTKDSTFVLKDNQGPRTRTTSLMINHNTGMNYYIQLTSYNTYLYYMTKPKITRSSATAEKQRVSYT